MRLSILGVGTAVPTHAMSQEQALELTSTIACRSAQQSRLAATLYRRAGVDNRFTVLPHKIAIKWAKESAIELGLDDGPGPGPSTARRMELYEEFAFPLALQACQEALTRSETPPDQITHLITVSCTGFSAPGVDVHLLGTLGLASDTQRVHVGFMGCHGAINGLRVAHALAALPTTGRVLLCAIELCSLHYRFQWDPQRMLGNALFADGAAALVGGKTDQRANEMSVAATGSCLVPDSIDAIRWRIGEHGFEMSVSPRVPELIVEHLRPWMVQWLGDNSLTIDDIRSWVIHPGGPRIVSAVEESLQLRSDAAAISRQVLAQYGNMSSPTVLFILERLCQQPSPGPCVMLGFGPGLMAEAALLL
jgi:predicted naringenin-chalcone synthase